MAQNRKTATRKTATRKPAARKAAARRASTAARDGDGHFKPDHHVRNAAFGATAALGAVAAGVAAAFKFGLLDRFLPRSEGHEAEDLLIEAPDQRGTDAADISPKRRAPKAFRPDMAAPMTAAEREALRPAEGHAPSFAADRGTTLA